MKGEEILISPPTLSISWFWLELGLDYWTTFMRLWLWGYGYGRVRYRCWVCVSFALGIVDPISSALIVLVMLAAFMYEGVLIMTIVSVGLRISRGSGIYFNW